MLETLNQVAKLKPDIVGIGGKGKIAKEILGVITKTSPSTQIGYWGKDADCDACGFLERWGVAPPY